ncbi:MULTISPECIES: DUF6622 family protein [Pseudomonas]|uniref:DUF1453 domain-containing protein n=1 Tax=Pseudomonas koreensis TaxID=198620 RepID=A0A9X2XKL8_9PSED|nr:MULTISPECIES: hypothetical protein [Pseudomonas]MBV4477372.1 hypothetical protein [Pseudomonas botevensis]MCU7251004.1 hypothetical protein [Pseudomonas koreensis]
MLAILQNTPLWVYAIFLLLVYFGLKARTSSHESRLAMLVTPPALIAWSLLSMDLTFNPALSLSYWFGTMLLGGGSAWLLFSPQGVVLDDSQNGLVVPGTWKMLVLYLLFFAVNYYFGYQDAVHPEQASAPDTLLFKTAASGFVCGLIGARSLKHYRLLRTLLAQPSRVSAQ